MERNLNFYLCDCGQEALVLEYDKEWPEIEVAIWFDGYRKNISWFQLKTIWNVIRNGTPYKDQVCLSIETAKEVRDKLDEYIKLSDSEEKNE